MKKIYIFLLLGLISLINVSGVRAQTAQNSFAKITFETKSDLDLIFSQSSYPVEYVKSQTPGQSYFIGLFNQSNLEFLTEKKLAVDIIDTNVSDLTNYIYISYPASDGLGDQKISQLGSYYKVAENKYLLRLAGRNIEEIDHNQFFIASLPDSPLPSPKYQTARITPEQFDLKNIDDDSNHFLNNSERNSFAIKSIIILLLITIVVLIYGTIKYKSHSSRDD